MTRYARNKKGFHWDYISPADLSTALKKTGCKHYIENIVQSDANEPFAVPESTTIYCYTEKQPKEPHHQLGAQAAAATFRTPDSDDGIAFFASRSGNSLK